MLFDGSTRTDGHGDITSMKITSGYVGIGDAEEHRFIIAAICETEGAAFDGTDCTRELNNAAVNVSARGVGWNPEGHLSCVSTEKMITHTPLSCRPSKATRDNRQRLP